jgi:hypothetical protein
MSTSSMARKLGIKAGHRVLVTGAPDGYLEEMGEMPEGASLATQPDGEPYDVVQAFVRDRAAVGSAGFQALRALKPGGLLWFSYPKKTSRIKTDINRDQGWDALTSRGWACIAQVSIDDAWSAGRFRPTADIKRAR